MKKILPKKPIYKKAGLINNIAIFNNFLTSIVDNFYLQFLHIDKFLTVTSKLFDFKIKPLLDTPMRF